MLGQWLGSAQHPAHPYTALQIRCQLHTEYCYFCNATESTMSQRVYDTLRATRHGDSIPQRHEVKPRSWRRHSMRCCWQHMTSRQAEHSCRACRASNLHNSVRGRGTSIMLLLLQLLLLLLLLLLPLLLFILLFLICQWPL